MGTTTTSTITSMHNYYALRKLLERNVPYTVHDLFGGKLPFKTREGMSLKARRYLRPVPVTTPAGEGVTPSSKSPTMDDVTLTLTQHIGWTEISDIVAATSQETVEAETVEWLSEDMHITRDYVIRDQLLAGTSVFYGNNVAGRSSIVTTIATTDLQTIERLMLRNSVRYFSVMTKGDTKIGTVPIGASFIAVGHTDLKKSIEALSGYIPVHQYAGQIEVYPSEVGAWGNFRFVLTPNGEIYEDAGGSVGTTGLISTTGSNIDVYPMLIIGKDAYDVVELNELSAKLIKHPFGHGDDPAEQRETMAWKMVLGVLIKNQQNMYRYEIGAKV